MQNMDYQVANAIRKEKALSEKRSQILAREPEQALEAILGADQPATLIQSFPDQDLYYLMHHIGSDDFFPVLALASSRQWEYFLDMDVWQGDRMDLPRMTETLELLFKADPQRLLRWIIMEKPDFLEYYFFKSMDIRILEHDQDPSEFGDDFTTLDHQFYFRFPEVTERVKEVVTGMALLTMGDEDEADPAGELEKNREQAETLITGMLNSLAEMDLSVCQAVLLESAAVIPAEVEEEQYRLRNVRLAEKGFLPHYEAVGVYQPMARGDLAPRGRSWLELPRLGTDLPVAPGFAETLMPHGSLFAKGLQGVREENILMNLQAEFAALVNQVISADKVRIRSRQDMDKMVGKTCNYLSVGLEVIHGQSEKCLPHHASAIITGYCLGDIFRVGAGAGVRLKTAAEKWYEGSWIACRGLSLTFLGENWLGVVGGLLLPRPLYFDNYVSGVLYRPFATAGDLVKITRDLARIQTLDTLFQAMDPELSPEISSIVTWKSVLLTLWARACMDMDCVVDMIPHSRFRTFFSALFDRGTSGEEKGHISEDTRTNFIQWLEQASGKKDLCRILSHVVTALLDEVEEEFGTVHESDIEPALMTTHFLLS